MLKFLCYRCKVNVNKKTIEKILKNDVQILSKLDTIITSQKQLDNWISKMEEAFDKNNNNDTTDLTNNDLKVIEMYGYYISMLLYI